MLVFPLIIAIIGGVALAFQSPINATLARYSDNVFSTVVNFGGGAILLLVFSFIFGQGDLSMIFHSPWWTLLGGLYGIIIVVCITVSVPALGIALTLTIVMLGQLLMSMLIDGLGLLGTQVIPIEPFRIIGCCVIATGIFMVYLGRKRGEEGKKGKKRFLQAGLSFLAGGAASLQSPTNVALSKDVGQIEASFYSFLSGFLLILVVFLVVKIIRKPSYEKPSFEKWMFIGGIFGATGVFTTVITTPYLGVTLMVTALMIGQLAGGMVVDALGLFRSQVVAMNKWRYIGLAVIFIGMILAMLAHR